MTDPIEPNSVQTRVNEMHETLAKVNQSLGLPVRSRGGESVPTDPIVAFLTARLDDEQRTAETATQGRWFWAEPSKDSWPCGDEPLQASQVAWDECPYYCTWSEPSDVHRGTPGKPGHEHLRTVEVIGSWGHDSYGTSVADEDKRHIVAWQPSRVLADVEAKRALIALAHPRELPTGEFNVLGENGDAVLSALASVYRDHPDFDPSWAS